MIPSRIPPSFFVTHSITIKEEPETGNQNHNPLETLPVDRLVNLSHTNISILHHNHCQHIPEHTRWGSYLFVVEVPRTVGLVQPGVELAHDE
jgi:hypothetical protein